MGQLFLLRRKEVITTEYVDHGVSASKAPDAAEAESARTRRGDDAEASQTEKRAGNPANNSYVLRTGRHGQLLIGEEEEDEEEENEEEKEEEKEEEEDEDDDEEPLQVKFQPLTRVLRGHGPVLPGRRLQQGQRSSGRP